MNLFSGILFEPGKGGGGGSLKWGSPIPEIPFIVYCSGVK